MVVQVGVSFVIVFLLEVAPDKKNCSQTLIAQHKCGTAFYFLSALALKENVTINRFVGAPSHGKS